jgi:hypothetical protein
MEIYKNLIIVAGSGRNVGKTEFACRLIRRFSSQIDLYGLKVSAIHPDEGIYHGDHAGLDVAAGPIEETRQDLAKDTSRMLQAGASRVFYLQGDDRQLAAGFQTVLTTVPAGSAIVCESSSLWQFVEPGLLILVTAPGCQIKPRARAILTRGPAIVESDGAGGFAEIERIRFSAADGWSLV